LANPALDQQRDEVAYRALLKPCMRALHGDRDLTGWNVGVLADKTRHDFVDQCPLADFRHLGIVRSAAGCVNARTITGTHNPT
jgi:hypothetical protein